MATSCAPLKARGSWDWAVATAFAVATLFVVARRSGPGDGGRLHVGASSLRLAGQAVPPPASGARVLRRPAHRDDAEGDAQQLPLRHRHRVPERHARLRDPRRRRPARVVPARDGRGRRPRRPHRVPVLAHPPGRRERPARDAPTAPSSAGCRRRGSTCTSPRCATASTSTRCGPAPSARSPMPRARRSSSSAPRLVGSVISTRATRGTVELVVEAYDETPIAVPGRWGGKPVTPALLRWRVTRPAAAPCRAGGRRSTTGS